MTPLNESQIRSGHRGCCGGSLGPKPFCEDWGCEEIATLLGLLDLERATTATAQARLDGVLDAYHASYRHGPDSDPARCPACHAAAMEMD